MQKIVLLGAASLVVSSACAKQPPVGAEVNRCKIALAYANALIEQLDNRIVFTHEGGQAYSRINAQGWFAEDGSPSASPPVALLTTANRRGRVDAMSSCPMIGEALKNSSKGRRVSVSKSMIKVSGIGKRDSKETKVGITLPVISTDRESAILFSSQVSGPLAAGAYAYYMRRSPKSGWIVVSSKPLTIA
jgi:hypothetical protein